MRSTIMKIEINRIDKDSGTMTITLESGDNKNWSDSTMLYHVKQTLQKMGYDVIKKRMWKDGHMVDDEQQYIKTRSHKVDKDSFCAWQVYYSVRTMADENKKYGSIELAMMFDIYEKPLNRTKKV